MLFALYSLPPGVLGNSVNTKPNKILIKGLLLIPLFYSCYGAMSVQFPRPVP